MLTQRNGSAYSFETLLVYCLRMLWRLDLPLPVGCLVLSVGLLLPVAVSAQTVGSDSGPLSEVSRSLKDSSRPVHERGRTVSEGSVGSMKSGPVRGNRRMGMLSGPVSEISVGPVSAGRSMTGGGSVAEHSSGAVKQEMDRSLGEQVYDLQRALGPLQDRVRQQAALDAAAAAESTGDAVDVGSDVPDAADAAVDIQPDSEHATDGVAVSGADDEGVPDAESDAESETDTEPMDDAVPENETN